MRKIILAVLPLIMLHFSCSKDKTDDFVDKNCGMAIFIKPTSELNDGGHVEWVSVVACGPAFQYYIERAEQWQLTIFYKGATRKKTKYLVCKLGSNVTLYTRYESGIIPAASIKYYEDKGYTVTVQELTGLERMVELD